MEQGTLTMDDRPAGAPILKKVARQRLQQLRRYLWVVVVVSLVAVAAAAYSVFAAGASYTAKSALVVSSPGRAPEQDAVLAVGYATLFNDPATIARLRAAKAISEVVGFEASTAAASPIVTVAATASDPKAAQDAAQVMAEAFRDDMNAAGKQVAETTVADLQRQVNELRSRPGPEGVVDPAIGALQESIANVQYYSTTNQLRDLQMTVGVVRNSRHTAMKLLMGLIGGIMAGVLSAFALAALSKRLTNPVDVREKTGVEPLIELPGSGSRKTGLREARIRMLANVLNARTGSTPLVLAVTDTRGVRGAQHVAEELAAIFAQQGRRTVVVRTDTDIDTGASGSAGFNDALLDSRMLGTLLNRGGVETLLEQLRPSADVVILAAPPIDDAAEGAEVICAAADATVLVISKRVSRADDVVSARESLISMGASVAGAILIEDKEYGLQPTPIRTGPTARHRSWVADPVQA